MGREENRRTRKAAVVSTDVAQKVILSVEIPNESSRDLTTSGALGVQHALLLALLLLLLLVVVRVHLMMNFVMRVIVKRMLTVVSMKALVMQSLTEFNRCKIKRNFTLDNRHF